MTSRYTAWLALQVARDTAVLNLLALTLTGSVAWWAMGHWPAPFGEWGRAAFTFALGVVYVALLLFGFVVG